MDKVMHRPQKNLILIKRPSQHRLAIEPASLNQLEIPAAIQGGDAVEAVAVDEVDIATQPKAVSVGQQSCGFVQYKMTDQQFRDYQCGLVDLEQFKSPVSDVKNENNDEHQVEVVRVVEFVNATSTSPSSLKLFDTGVVDNMNASVSMSTVPEPANNANVSCDAVKNESMVSNAFSSLDDKKKRKSDEKTIRIKVHKNLLKNYGIKMSPNNAPKEMNLALKDNEVNADDLIWNEFLIMGDSMMVNLSGNFSRLDYSKQGPKRF